MKTYLVVLIFACAIGVIESRKKSHAHHQHAHKHSARRNGTAANATANATAAPKGSNITDPSEKNDFFIRDYGTFIIGLRDLNNPNLAAENAAAEAEGAAGGAATAPVTKRKLFMTTVGNATATDTTINDATALGPIAPGSEFPDLDMFSSYNKIQLPIFCKSKLDEKQLMGIAYNAKKFVTAWRKAAGADTALFTQLPCLDADQFAAYYKEVNANAKAASDEVPAADAETEKDNLMRVINFMDPKLTKVCNMQYWVYMCSNGIQPDDKEYRHEDGRSETKFDAYLAKKLGLKMAAAGAKFGSAFQGGSAKKKASRKFRKVRK